MELSNPVKVLFLGTRSPGSACVSKEHWTLMTLKYLKGQKIHSFFLLLREMNLFCIWKIVPIQATWFSSYLHVTCSYSFTTRFQFIKCLRLVSRVIDEGWTLNWNKMFWFVYKGWRQNSTSTFTCKPFLTNVRVHKRIYHMCKSRVYLKVHNFLISTNENGIRD